MKILFAARPDLLTRKGGDTVQILKTKAAIEALSGTKIGLCLNPEELATFGPVDLVHVFNLQTTDVTLAFIREARKMGAKVALSTIYWNLWHAAFVDKIRSRLPSFYLGFVPFLERPWRFLFQGRAAKTGFLGKTYVEQKREIVDNADLLLPNSDEEIATVASDTGLRLTELVGKSVVVPNAVDLSSLPDVVRGQEALFESRKAVAVVGRIEPIKNQLAVIQALADQPAVPILIIGRRSSDPKHDDYCNQVVAAGRNRGNVRFIDEIPHDEVMALLTTAKVHVLASFRESPGLATLEALHAGCNIVTSTATYCPIDYYSFEEFGSQCNPFSINSIRKAIRKELNAPVPRVTAKYFEQFSYDCVAERTYAAYEKLNNKQLSPELR
jgi:glycosyltransferase involved in cell wall biosynthesis